MHSLTPDPAHAVIAVVTQLGHDRSGRRISPVVGALRLSTTATRNRPLTSLVSQSRPRGNGTAVFESNAPLKAQLKSSIDYADGMDLDNADHLVAAVGASERSRRLPF